MNGLNPYVYPSDVPIRKAADGSVLEREHGMTLWDYYAGQALAGIANTAATHSTVTWPNLARACADIADAMLAERERRGIA